MGPVDKLTRERIAAELKGLPQWSLEGNAIARTFKFKDFKEAMSFVDRVAALAEKAQHHPDILVRFNKVTLTLSTHDAGGVTAKDIEFARAAPAG